MEQAVAFLDGDGVGKGWGFLMGDGLARYLMIDE